MIVEDKAQRLSNGAIKVSQCSRCKLHETRTNTVFGDGNPNADLMVVAEAPGQTEDEQGICLCGKSGKLYDTWLRVELGLSRKDVFTCNTVKCRPPGNRDPQPDELVACRPFLDRQIEIIQPKVIVTLGRVSATALLNDPSFRITKHHGIWRDYNGIDLMPVYHPAYLLRQMSEENKTAVKEDLAKVLSKLKGSKDEKDRSN